MAASGRCAASSAVATSVTAPELEKASSRAATAVRNAAIRADCVSGALRRKGGSASHQSSSGSGVGASSQIDKRIVGAGESWLRKVSPT